MIIAEQKSLDEIKALIGEAEKVLVVGCGTCVTVCFAGGSREAEITSSALRMSSKLEGKAGPCLYDQSKWPQRSEYGNHP